ncbi:MAG: glycosyltransferase family 4 protein [Verrucomicrobia bacterium]|nr:glycosyltransferase family 4 protein [Verrucomicrobiota bacterium]
MHITIVMGFFLPLPPVAGGATEKSWHGLAREFAARGHAVTVISRRWPGWADRETIDGVTHLRLPGYAHTASLARNLLRDFIWSWRVWFALPPADLTIVNCVALPVWLGWFRRHAGLLAVMTGRVPKGQYRLYRRLDRVLAVSSAVRADLLAENPRFASVTKVSGYPIPWRALHQSRPVPAPGAPVTFGFVGRINREKGLGLLVSAFALLAQDVGLPPWRVLFCGPVDIARGGSGPDFVAELQATLAAALPADTFEFRPPVFDDAALGAVYREIDVFCYPSLAARGETFGVAVAEAMAAGAVPVVSRLPCFTDFVRDGANGLVFAHEAPDAAARLVAALRRLLLDPSLRSALARNAETDTRVYDFPEFAARLLADFSSLQ